MTHGPRVAVHALPVARLGRSRGTEATSATRATRSRRGIRVRARHGRQQLARLVVELERHRHRIGRQPIHERWRRLSVQANDRHRLVQIRRARRLLGLRLPTQRREVLHHPERSTMRADREVVVAQHHVAYGHRRQVFLQALPVGTRIVRHVHATLGGRVHHARPVQVFTNRPREMICRNAVRNLGPGHTVVGGAIEIWREVVQLIPVARYPGRTRGMRRRFDDAPAHPLR